MKCLPSPGSSASMTSESITGMWRAGPPAADKPTPRPAIIPVLPLARRFRGAPRRAICGDRGPFGALPPNWLQIGMLPEPLRQNGASVLIDRKDFACAEQGGGELVALVRIGRQTFDKAVDLVDQPLASCVERRRIERRVAINAVKAVLGEDCAERCRNGDSALRVDFIGESRDKLVHLPLWAPD